MSELTLLAAPIVVAGVFALSGAAKLRDSSDGVRGLRELQVPDILVRDWVARAHPLVEIVLALGLLLLPTPWRTVAAVGAVVLMAAYTGLVIGAVRRAKDVHCNCFGGRDEIVNGRTVARNVALLALALAALADCASPAAPLVRVLGGLDPLAWTGILAVTALIGWLIGRGYAAPPTPAPDAADFGGHLWSAEPDVAELDVERKPIPDLTLTAADGSTVTLAELAAKRAVVLLFLEPVCGPCGTLLRQLSAWQDLLPQVSVVHVRTWPVRDVRSPGDQVAGTPDDGPPPGEPFISYPGGYWAHVSAKEVFDTPGQTPWAVLLGADGLIAGGPAVGFVDVRAFLIEVMAHLAGLA